MESLLANLARKERDRLRVSRVDVDEHPELVDRLDVTEVPTPSCSPAASPWLASRAGRARPASNE